MAAKTTASTSAKKGRRKQSPAQWHEALQRFKTSGLSVQAFCAREGLSQSCFYRWKSAAADAAQAPCGEATQTPVWPLTKRPSGFVDMGPLQTLEPPAPALQAALLQLNLRIDLGGGLVLRLERA